MLELNSIKLLKPLEVGEHQATLIEWCNISDEKGDRLRMTFKFEDREYKQTIFESNLSYWLNGLFNQMDLETGTDAIVMLNSAIGTSFKIWVSHNEYGTNLSLYPPKPSKPTANEPTKLEETPLV